MSLVPRGANLMQTMLKEDGAMQLGTLTKAAPDFGTKGELLAVVYAPERIDAHGDWADADGIEKMASDFMLRGAKLDIRHDGKALEKSRAAVTQSFIVQKGDPRFEGFKDEEGKDVDVAGSWAVVIKINDPELRAKYESGEWGGVSMGGRAFYEEAAPPLAKEDKEAASAFAWLKSFFKSSQNGEEAMDEAKLEERLKKHREDVKSDLRDLLKEEGVIKDKPKEAPVTKTAEETTPTAEDLRKQADKIELEAALAKGDAEAVRKIADRMSNTEPEEIRKARADKEAAEKTLADYQARSNQGGGGKDSPLSKEDDSGEPSKELVDSLLKEINGKES